MRACVHVCVCAYVRVCRWLRRWDPSELYPANEDGTLHASGRAELRGLAGRLQARYPRLLPAVSPGPTLAVRATAKPRAQQSARAFVAGLRGGANADQHEQDEDGTGNTGSKEC